MLRGYELHADSTPLSKHLFRKDAPAEAESSLVDNEMSTGLGWKPEQAKSSDGCCGRVHELEWSVIPLVRGTPGGNTWQPPSVLFPIPKQKKEREMYLSLIHISEPTRPY